jgi:hypothetical protein
MAKKRTKADRLERQIEQLEKREDRQPDEIEKEPSTLAPKSDEPPVLIPIEQQIQQRAYELYEQRGRTDGHDWDDWLQAECEIRGTHANATAAELLAVQPEVRWRLRASHKSVSAPGGFNCVTSDEPIPVGS